MRLLILTLFVVCSNGATTNHFFGKNEENEDTKGMGQDKCDSWLSICRDEDSYPNIGQGFRGYNPVLGDPLALAGDPGFQSHIFDEGSEREANSRFGFTAGHDLNRCNGNVLADFLQTYDELFSSITESEGGQSGFEVGPEMEISGTLGVEGAEVTASRNIPPYFQSMGSHSNVMKSTATDISFHERRVTRSKFSCYEYEFQITDGEHPNVTPFFIDSVKELDACLEKLNDYKDRTRAHSECVKQFFRDYGTHYIKSAKFGSTMSVITIIDKKAEQKSNTNTLKECSKENSQWSFLGLFGGGSISSKCKDSIFDRQSSSNNFLLNEFIMTVGSRPASNYDEWSKQSGKPEIVKKIIAPISNLLKEKFLRNDRYGHVLDKNRFNSDGYAKIKILLDHYIVDYCQLFPAHCTYVVKRPYCQSQKNAFKFEFCDCKPSQHNCGLYTGQINENFLPNGEGTMNIQGGYIRSTKWRNGLNEGKAQDCFEDNTVYGPVPEEGLPVLSNVLKPKDCQRFCQEMDGCKYFSWYLPQKKCFPHSFINVTAISGFVTSGPKYCNYS